MGQGRRLLIGLTGSATANRFASGVPPRGLDLEMFWSKTGGEFGQRRRSAGAVEGTELCGVPATTTTILSWMSEDLALTVKAENFQSYLSAVNKAHVHLELVKLAVGDRVTAVRQSIKSGQVPAVSLG